MSTLPKKIREELAELKLKPESHIDLSDIPETTEQDWANATRGRFYKPIKKQLTVRVDADVIEWLRTRGKGFHTRINQILRNAMIRDLKTPK